MFLFKYFIIALIIIGTFVAGSLGIGGENWLSKIGYAIFFIVGFLILNFIAKIAWRILFLILSVFFAIYLLSYFGIIEFSLPGLSSATQKLIEDVDIKKGLTEK